MFKFHQKVILLLCLGSLLLSPFHAEAKEKADTGNQAERALAAANVLGQIMKTPETDIPKELLERAHAIAVIPRMIKGAFGVGGTHGKGLVARRTAKAWGTPAFIDMSGGSFGLQIGVSSTDLVLVFTKEDGLKGLLEDKLELGAEAGATAGPVGRTAEAGTNVTFDSPIYSYSRSKGLFAGIALKGTVMTIDDSANHKVYGKNVTGKDILLGGAVPVTPVVRPFVRALQTYTTQAIVEGKENAEKRATAIAPVSEHAAPALKSEDIKKAQEALRDKGYDPGPIDGALGPKTRAAIRQYQKGEKLPVTSHLDRETAAKLGVRAQ